MKKYNSSDLKNHLTLLDQSHSLYFDLINTSRNRELLTSLWGCNIGWIGLNGKRLTIIVSKIGYREGYHT